MKYDPATGRGVMNYADVRNAAEEAIRLLQQTFDDTGQRPIPPQLVKVESLLLRIAGATPV